MFNQKKIVIRGAGDLSSGVAARLWRSGFPVIMTEVDQPLTVRRTVSFSDAVYEGETTVEGILARRVGDEVGKTGGCVIVKYSRHTRTVIWSWMRP